jgi:hypothetical protein
MADSTDRPKRGSSDATDQSPTTPPETRNEAEEERHPSDPRLQPGGAHPTKWDPGMSSLDRDEALSRGQSSEQADDTQPAEKRTV